MRYGLIVFDVDGTLAKRYTLEILPGVWEFFHLVYGQKCSESPKIAIATNQGGVGMRRWMELGKFGKPDKYPTEAEIDERLEALAKLLGAEAGLPVYVSYRYRTKPGKWVPIPPEGRGSPRWERSWRKPDGGMLVQAMKGAGVSPQETLFVGDSDDDQGAAQAAGCAFERAEVFFARDWRECEALANL